MRGRGSAQSSAKLSTLIMLMNAGGFTSVMRILGPAHSFVLVQGQMHAWAPHL